MTRSAALFIAILVAIVQVCTAFYFTDGVYELELERHLLTGNSRGGPAELIPKGQSADQLWRVTQDETSLVTISNEKSGLYLAFNEDPEPNKFLILSDAPLSWKLSQIDDKFFIEAVKEFEGRRLVAAISPIRIWPPPAALSWAQKSDDQKWTLTKIAD
ncbi:hypothetical protein EC957_005835 [Mortierella hygrophila]|uniref:Ricin B lectin domain-containing protein n=1 Tax=Mortierella hygrophila TaxID=979708 RepID=A0A9P6F0E9_9FUNG|nr:hypothetical protein EC957_005835 [Mortierella hygrophila]